VAAESPLSAIVRIEIKIWQIDLHITSSSCPY
jgi:hypothetical protein